MSDDELSTFRAIARENAERFRLMAEWDGSARAMEVVGANLETAAKALRSMAWSLRAMAKQAKRAGRL